MKVKKLQCRVRWQLQAGCQYADGKGHCLAPLDSTCRQTNAIYAYDRVDGEPYAWHHKPY